MHWVNGDRCIAMPVQSCAPLFMIQKDKHSNFLGFTDSFAHLTGYKNPIDLLGLTDFELRCPMASLSGDFITRDQWSLARPGEVCKTVTVTTFSDRILRVLYTEKYVKDGVIMVSSWQLKQGPIFNYIHYLTRGLNKNYTESVSRDYHLISSYPTLTPKQSAVLFFLMHGVRIKVIAQVLSLSVRTVEHYVAFIKDRMECAYGSQCVELGHVLGYDRQVPLSLVDCDLLACIQESGSRFIS